MSQQHSGLVFCCEIRCFHFHSTKNMFWMICRKIAAFQSVFSELCWVLRDLIQKDVFAFFFRPVLNFVVLWRSILALFQLNYASFMFITLKTCFGLFGTSFALSLALLHLKTVLWLVSDNRLYHSTQRVFAFLCPNHAHFSFFCTDNMLAFVCNKTGLFWVLSRGKERFPFFVPQLRCFPLCRIRDIVSFVCREFCCFNVMAPEKRISIFCCKIILSAAFSHGKKVFFLFAANCTNFLSVLVKTNWRPNHAVFSFNAPEACFGFLCGKLRCFRLFTWKRFLYSQLNRAVLSCISRTRRFLLFSLLNHAVRGFIA